MAIERINGLTLAGLKDLIDSLGYFAASDESSGTYTFYADAEKQKPVLQYTSSYFRFSSTGNVNGAGTPYIGASYTVAPKYAMKTRNGLLLSNVVEYASSSWTPWMGIIGKSNNGAVAAAFSRQGSQSDFVYMNSSAYGEQTVTGVGYLTFRSQYNKPTNANLTSQVAGCQIPTCPDAGTSYIKGALGLVLAPWNYYWGKVIIGGINYASNGFIALNDEV